MDNKLPFRILAIDPAITKSGWAVLRLESIYPLSIIVEASGQIDGQKILKNKKEMLLSFNRQFCVLDALYEEYCNLIMAFKPDQVVSEGAFGHSFLAVLVSLTLTINCLRRASSMIIGKDIIEVTPSISKKCFAGHGGSDKDAMRKAYDQASYLIKEDNEDNISEHQIDAISHGVAYVHLYWIKDIVQISSKEMKRKRLIKLKDKMKLQ